MATKTQIEMIFNKIADAIPVDFVNGFNEVQSGMLAVLRFLDECGGEATAGQISQALNISTARVSVLLRKLTDKKLITKEKDLMDGRITLVKFTELGKITISKIKENIYRQINAIIDVVGEERLLEFITVSTEIKAVLEQMSSPKLY
ncbi:MAG: MarR family winged helix-turn-helix transcriptional regulator [Eubacteriales bacterium]|nr:MarR family winged helix-turn-helix transcriptional regulator [Eubacteriales bacterium]